MFWHKEKQMEFWFSEFHTPDVKHSIRVNRQLYSKQSDYQRIDIFETPEFGRVLTLDAPDDNATFRTTILDMQTLMNQGVSTLVLKTGKTSTTLNLTLLCQDQKPGTRVTLRHLGSSAHLTVGFRSRRDLIVGR